MTVAELMGILREMPQDMAVFVVLCDYDGTSDVYREQDPEVILTGFGVFLIPEGDLYYKHFVAGG